MSHACLVDTTRCIGCRSCQVACKQWNELPAETTQTADAGATYENPPALSSKTRTRVTFHELCDANGDLDRCVFVKQQCMQCLEPSCAAACPVAALKKDEITGAVVYDAHRCMGCRYCMMACPFDVPKLEWDRLAPHISKCTFCFERQAETPVASAAVNGQTLSPESTRRLQKGQRKPACAAVCPTGAIQFGDRDELLQEARQRIANRNGLPAASWKYVNHIYGEKEVGGTSWLYISNEPFERLGFRMDLGERPPSHYTRVALGVVPVAVLTVGAAMGGAYWFTQRVNKVAAANRVTNNEATEGTDHEA